MKLKIKFIIILKYKKRIKRNNIIVISYYGNTKIICKSLVILGDYEQDKINIKSILLILYL